MSVSYLILIFSLVIIVQGDAAMAQQDYQTALENYDTLALLMAPSHVAARTNAALARIKLGGVSE